MISNVLSGDAKEALLPSSGELKEVFDKKYGGQDKIGWGPTRRQKWGYYLPADVYEGCVVKQVFDGCSWIDIGGGRSLFPDNPGLARLLVSRCSRVVAVDPSENVKENDFTHSRFQCCLEEYRPDACFDLATLRMVVEHVEKPPEFIDALWRVLRPGGRVVVFTVNKTSPITLVSRTLPFALHYPIKRFLWGGDEEDTFPVRYRMNTKHILGELFRRQGFSELAFAYLDDLSTFNQFRCLGRLELFVWRLCQEAGLKYPENCLLGVYEKPT